MNLSETTNKITGHTNIFWLITFVILTYAFILGILIIKKYFEARKGRYHPQSNHPSIVGIGTMLTAFVIVIPSTRNFILSLMVQVVNEIFKTNFVNIPYDLSLSEVGVFTIFGIVVVGIIFITYQRRRYDRKHQSVKRNKIFISHAPEDREKIVTPLFDQLTSQGHDVSYDSNSTSVTNSFLPEFSEALSLPDIYIVIASVAYNESKDCKKELAAIIAKCADTPKRMLIARVDDAPAKEFIRNFKQVEISSSALQETKSLVKLSMKLEETINTISTDLPISERTYSKNQVKRFVELLFEADKDENFGQNLLETRRRNHDNVAVSQNDTALEVEGLILIKPGGTFYEPCLKKLFERVCEKCQIQQLRLFDGERIASKKLFENQYTSPTKLANGEIELNEEDYKEIRSIYDKDEFKNSYGVPYEDVLIVPALQLTKPPYSINPNIISEYWEQGRADDKFWNKKWNGLNKIGYQKTVYPIKFQELQEEPKVRIVLNGFIPGYRALFVDPNARTIAIHVTSRFPWKDIREKLVGGASNPKACESGSIRKDASLGLIPLDPSEPHIPKVNGQRNVCHSSATILDGMRELMFWFDYPSSQTILGNILQLEGLPPEDITKVTQEYLEDISWTSRNDSFSEIFYEARQSIVFDSLKNTHTKVNAAVESYAEDAGVEPDAIREYEPLLNFIENGIRLEIAGDQYYLFTIIKNLIENEKQRTVFFEITKSLKLSVQSGDEQNSFDILAEAYRIAASDLCFLNSLTYQTELAFPKLFRTTVIAELPENALSCAKRTKKNLVKRIMATHHGDDSRDFSSTTIQDTLEWKKFISTPEVNISQEESDVSIIGLILAGGRSTRMSSTIPKAVLSFGTELLFDSVLTHLREAISENVEFYAAIGFRPKLLRLALGDRVKFLEYEKTLGLAFRVATCLERLKREVGEDALIMLTYTDMPFVSPPAVKRLKESIGNDKTFGLLTSYTDKLSGHVEEQDGKIKRVIQKRLNPDECADNMRRDFGLYMFYNTEEFRDALLSIENSNVRNEFIFADIIEILHNNGWDIVSQNVEPSDSESVNTASDLLRITSKIIENRNFNYYKNVMQQNYGLKIPEHLDQNTFKTSVESHSGPVYFFSWWEKDWVSKQ